MKERIKIIKSRHIDADKWNACVHKHDNGLIYATTDYLHAMAKHWHGLVVGDYHAVMPLPWKKKMGIRYGYTPPFTQQLGIIGYVPENEIVRILKMVYRFVAFSDIHFNFRNTDVQQYLPVIPRTNLVIDMSCAYEDITRHYKSNLKENLRKAGACGLNYSEADIRTGMEMYHDHYRSRTKHVRDKDYAHFSALCTALSHHGKCLARAATDSTGEIFAIAVLLKDEKRVYNIMNTTTAGGRDLEANHFLLDRIIREFCGQQLLFDFEGSELSGVREFYEAFGAVNQPYFHYRYNGYTWPSEILKVRTRG